MIIGIISIVFGAILFIVNLVKGVETVQQQTVQYLGYLISTVLILGGVILVLIKKYIEELNSSIYSLKDSLKKEDMRTINPAPIVNSSTVESQTKKCKQCSKRIGANLEKCPYCGSVEFLWD